MVYGDTINLNAKGYSDIKNITDEVQRIIRDSSLKSEIVNISVIGSTASISINSERSSTFFSDWQRRLTSSKCLYNMLYK